LQVPQGNGIVTFFKQKGNAQGNPETRNRVEGKVIKKEQAQVAQPVFTVKYHASSDTAPARRRLHFAKSRVSGPNTLSEIQKTPALKEKKDKRGDVAGCAWVQTPEKTLV